MMNRREERIKIEEKALLGATISFPESTEQKVPAVLLIAGSGAGDRDGNMPKLQLNLYKMIADGLAEAGFISLRYDKRGVGESEGELNKVGLWDLVDDAESALQFLRNLTNVDQEQVYVLGHSEGTILATALNERASLAGLILIAGAADTIEEATKYQRELAYEELNNESGIKGWLIKKLKITNKAEKKTQKIFAKMSKSDKDEIRVQLFAKLPAKWFREHFQFDLYGSMENITCPVLAINGTKDIQTKVENVYKVPELVNGPSEVHVIEGMNHILRYQEGDVSIQKVKSVYQAQASKRLHPDLMHIITNWLERNHAGR
ncbi:alpha/beta hydrolase family protein [Alkalihalobacterium alkalinitrilicum]|uniref:alpha/beta hydrolase family protein n=1 Tax=Alkalihalobacterium alkalinitrilicum TaxID=427920 RepID=UPI0011545726|nr:alpha/beta hydrolase [Alkalihalobacterium alkalinitrilicum]